MSNPVEQPQKIMDIVNPEVYNKLVESDEKSQDSMVTAFVENKINEERNEEIKQNVKPFETSTDPVRDPIVTKPITMVAYEDSEQSVAKDTNKELNEVEPESETEQESFEDMDYLEYPRDNYTGYSDYNDSEFHQGLSTKCKIGLIISSILAIACILAAVLCYTKGKLKLTPMIIAIIVSLVIPLVTWVIMG